MRREWVLWFEWVARLIVWGSGLILAGITISDYIYIHTMPESTVTMLIIFITIFFVAALVTWGFDVWRLYPPRRRQERRRRANPPRGSATERFKFILKVIGVAVLGAGFVVGLGVIFGKQYGILNAPTLTLGAINVLVMLLLAYYTYKYAKSTALMANEMKEQNVARYTYLANKWYEIKERELSNPNFTDPAKTSRYKVFFKGDSLRKYETFAWICWGHAEDIYQNNWHEDPGFKPTIKWYKSLHHNWLKEPMNRERFALDFIRYIDSL